MKDIYVEQPPPSAGDSRRNLPEGYMVSEAAYPPQALAEEFSKNEILK